MGGRIGDRGKRVSFSSGIRYTIFYFDDSKIKSSQISTCSTDPHEMELVSGG